MCNQVTDNVCLTRKMFPNSKRAFQIAHSKSDGRGIDLEGVEARDRLRVDLADADLAVCASSDKYPVR